MSVFLKKFLIFPLFVIAANHLVSQTDTAKTPVPEEEEDYSQYENVQPEGEIKTWCNPKIFDLSPNRFISVGYDYIHTSKMRLSNSGSYAENDRNQTDLKSYELLTHGLRINANIPVISKSKLLWQIGGGYFRSNYFVNEGERVYDSSSRDAFYKILKEQGLHAFNLNTTIFKPLGEKTFFIVQLMSEINGNFSLNQKEVRMPGSNIIRSSGSILYGKRPHDRLQWAFGVSRTYRAGELNYAPVILYNYTALNRKWGCEILFPARAAYRRKFTSRNILLAGYELEGNSYRILSKKNNVDNFELRRSELRLRFDYQRQLYGFVWIGLQAGLRYNISFNADKLVENNPDFFRGFFGNQKYLMLNEVAPAPYINISINLVSP